MVEMAKEQIVQILMNRGMRRSEAEDIVQETQYAINDVLAGESNNYLTAEQVVDEYLDLPPDYVWPFMYDELPKEGGCL